jgi:uncharacterized protein
MTKPFIGRERELAELDATARRPGAKLVVIKGRRRVGKSRLAKEFARRHPGMACHDVTGLPPSEVGSGAAVLENVAGQLSRLFKMPAPSPKSWDDLFWHLADRLAGGNAILVLDEVNWLGRWDPLFSARLWALWETNLSRLDNFILILSGSLAGWIDDKFSSNTGYVGRISWNMTLDELPIRDALRFFGARRSRISLHEQLQMLLVTGGIPRYLEELDPRQSAEENILRLCFNSSSLLFLEYDHLMNDLFQRSNRISRAIIEALAERPLTLDQLRDALGRKRSGVLSGHVERLEKSGFLMRCHTWNPSTGQPSNRYKIRIIDSYIRFYLKAIRPASSQIRQGRFQLPANIHGLLGLQFENLVLKNRRLLLPALGVDPADVVMEGPYFQEKTTEHAGCQIDYLVQTRYALHVLEIRFSRNLISSDVIGEVQDKIGALVVPRNKSVRPALLHVNGVADGVVDADYFDKIIDFGALATQ